MISTGFQKLAYLRCPRYFLLNTIFVNTEERQLILDLSPLGTDGALPFQGNGYFFAQVKADESGAQDRCDEMRAGGRLLQVDTVEEMRFVQSILHQQMMNLTTDEEYRAMWYIGKFDWSELSAPGL